MLVSYGLGNPVGTSNGTALVEAVRGVADRSPRGGLVPSEFFGTVKATTIKGVLSKDDMAKITGRTITGVMR